MKSGEKSCDSSDDDYFPSQSSYNATSVASDDISDQSFSVESDLEEEELRGHKEPKYMGFWSYLSLLFSWIHCPLCGCFEVNHSVHSVKGTLLTVIIKCKHCGNSPTDQCKPTLWTSQPRLGKYSAGDICLSAAILFSGSTVTKVLRMLQHMGVKCYKRRTFFRHQRAVLQSAVDLVWEHEHIALIAALWDENENVIGGDGKADSPGHSAKFGTYKLMELNCNKIIDIQLVQSNEVCGSYHMEQEGLTRGVDLLQAHGLHFNKLVTDRHVSIAKWVRENLPHVTHLYDLWHVGKGFRKKLDSVAKERDCFALRSWINSIINHMYCINHMYLRMAASTPDGSPELVVSPSKGSTAIGC